MQHLGSAGFDKDDQTYQEAFITTYRTFIEPEVLIEKLLYRYHKFVGLSSADKGSQSVANNAFSLLVCVVEDLVIADLQTPLLQTLAEFQHELLSKGEFKWAKGLRFGLVKKLKTRKKYREPPESLTTKAVTTKQMALIDFKSQEIAEQMTLLDADLFHKVKAPVKLCNNS